MNLNKRFKQSRPMLWRGVIATFLWAIIISCFVTSVRAVNLTDKAVAHIQRKAVTPERMEDERLVCEAAKKYVQAWCTFDADLQDYAARMRAFGIDNTGASPEGTQRCNSVVVMKVNKLPGEKIYRVLLAVNVSRVVTKTNDQGGTPPANKLLAAQIKGEEQEISYWKDYDETLEVTLKVDGNKKGIVIMGTPVSKSQQAYGYLRPDDVVGRGEVPEDFRVFAGQALEMYYSGKDMDNYVSPGASVSPVGNYKVDNVDVQTLVWNKNIARAVAKVELSAEGISNRQELVVLEAVKKDRWLLLRLGGC